MRLKSCFLGFVALILFGAGCANSVTVSAPPTPVVEAPSSGAAFNVPATFTIGKSLTFQDGIVLTLTAINDSRCKPGVQCIWAGELSPVFAFQDIDKGTQEFTLGTVRAAEVTIKGYTISLVEATTDSATVKVVKK